MTRTFLALELPEPVKHALRRQITHLAQALPDIQWVDPAGLHLTLAFLGELDDDRMEAATESAQSAAHIHQPFTLRLARLGTFGSARSPRVIWVGLTGETARLLALQASVADELSARGFPREARPFAPHLTLARIKKPLSDGSLNSLTHALGGPAENVSWQADAVSVMKSELLRPAARYTALSRWPLTGA